MTIPNFPGKLIERPDDILTLMNHPKCVFISYDSWPSKTKLSKLNWMLVWICATNSYYLMKTADFWSKDVQRWINYERRTYLEYLCDTELVGC